VQEWFSSRTQASEVCPSLFRKPSPPPPVPLRAMWILQQARTGHYSQVAEYEAAKARMESYFEARHQKALEYREQIAFEEEEERRRTSTPPHSDDIASDGALSTDSEEDSNIADQRQQQQRENDFELEPEQEAAPQDQRDRAVYDEWRDNLVDVEEEISSDESVLTTDESEGENVDECPEPENPVEEVDVPLPREGQIRPISPDDPAERPPRVIAQIVEDREFRPMPEEEEMFECKRFFPHQRYDQIFDSGNVAEFAEYAEKTREGVRKLLESDLQFISHERAIRKVEAVFDEALQPEWLQSKLNLSEERNRNQRAENIVPDEIPLRLDPFRSITKVLNEDFQRLNKGIKPEGVWRVNGEIIVPHRSDRKVRFSDELDRSLISDVTVRSDWGKLYCPLSEAVNVSEELPAVRPLPKSTYGKWKPPVKPLVDTRNARRARRRLENDANTYFTRNMKALGIEYEAQFIESKSFIEEYFLKRICLGVEIVIHQTREERQKIARLAQVVTDKGMGITAKADEVEISKS
jgi:hypothetical protein